MWRASGKTRRTRVGRCCMLSPSALSWTVLEHDRRRIACQGSSREMGSSRSFICRWYFRFIPLRPRQSILLSFRHLFVGSRAGQEEVPQHLLDCIRSEADFYARSAAAPIKWLTPTRVWPSWQTRRGTSPFSCWWRRYESLRHCKWVDEIIEDAPWYPDVAFLDKHNIDFICHDALPYGADGVDDIYAEIKKANRFCATERTEVWGDR